MGEISGKAVLVREDLNVPMKDDLVTDDTRLRAAVPTVNELSDRGAKVLILAHFGRPKGLVNPDMSLAQTVSALSSVLGRPVDRKSKRLNSSHYCASLKPSSSSTKKINI